jgi:PAS domain S-box-containing protein
VKLENPERNLKEINKELKETNRFNSLLLDNSPMPILVINPDSSIRYVNKAVEKLTGFSALELIGTKVPYLFWPPDRQSEYLGEFHGDSFIDKRVLEKTFSPNRGRSSGWK